MSKQLIREIEITKMLEGSLTGDALKVVNFFDNLFDSIVFKTMEPESIYMIIDDVIYMEQDYKNDRLWCRYEGYWSFFETEFGYNYHEISDLVEYMVEEQLKKKVGTPTFRLDIPIILVEEQLKKKVGTPRKLPVVLSCEVEEQLKKKVGTPRLLFRPSQYW